MNITRAKELLRNAIKDLEKQLEQMKFNNAEELHKIVLMKLFMTEDEYLEIMNESYALYSRIFHLKMNCSDQ